MRLFLVVLLPLASVLTAFPAFHDGIPLMCGGDTLVAGSISSPTVFDWNGDGVKDLLVADVETIQGSTYGLIRFYKNTGTNPVPVFTDFQYMQADGADIHTKGYC